MSNNKPSSVELLAIAIYEKFKMEGDGNELNDLLEHYKAIHKWEIEDAYWKGGIDIPYNGEQCQKYYNETYGGNNEKK